VRRRRFAVGLLAAAVLGGCGSSPNGLTSGQRAGLIAQLEAVRVQAAAKSVTGTEAALRRFRASVARLERDGALSDDAARLLRQGAQRILTRVQADAAPPPAPTPTAPQTTPTPPPKKKHEPKKEEHKKHDKGKGHKKH
jgi:hypothetical protein